VPLDPKFGLLLSQQFPVTWDNIEIDEGTVDELNLLTYAWARDAIFGPTQETVARVRRVAKENRALLGRFRYRPPRVWVSRGDEDTSGVHDFTSETSGVRSADVPWRWPTHIPTHLPRPGVDRLARSKHRWRLPVKNPMTEDHSAAAVMSVRTTWFSDLTLACRILKPIASRRAQMRPAARVADGHLLSVSSACLAWVTTGGMNVALLTNAVPIE
jgi:hypothetical protein